MNRRQDALSSAEAFRLTDGSSAPAAAPQGFTVPSAEPPVFRFDLMRGLQMHRRLVWGFALAGVILAVAYAAKNWSIYTAQSFVYIQPTPTRVLEGAAPMHWPYNYDPATYDSYLQQQLLSMTRQDVLTSAVHKLDGVWQRGGESEQSAADRLKGAVEVARVGTSYQVSVTAHASNPDTAAAAANAVANSYIENTAHEQKIGDSSRLAMLHDERDRVKKELDDDRSEQASLNAQLGVAGIGAVAPVHYDDDIARMHDELVKARADHDEAAARLTALSVSRGGTSALDAQADQAIATDAGLSSLKNSLQQRRAVLVSQMANLTPNHPQYKQDAAELSQIDGALDSASNNLRAKTATRIEGQLRADLDRTASVESRLNGQIAQMTHTAAGATPKLQRANDLANDITRLQTRYATVDEQLQNMALEDSAPGTAHLAAAAAAPAHPSVAGVIRNAVAILILFLLLGVSIALIAQKMDPRIYVASDVENLLGLAPMALLPDFDEVSEAVAGEHLLRLTAGIEYAAKEGDVRNYVFTGTGSGAGVTTLANRVKELLAPMGRSAEILSSAEAAMGNEIRATQSVSHSTALLHPVAETAEAKRAKVFLTDAAPLTVSAETEYLSRFADCIIVVIESGVTTRAQLRATADRLQRLDAAAVGFVLNRVSLTKADPAFRRAIGETENHVRSQERRPIHSRSVPSASSATPTWTGAELKQPQPAASQLSPYSVPPARSVQPVHEEPSVQVASAAAPVASPVPQAPAQPPVQSEEQTPWWLVEQPVHSDAPLAAPGKARIGNWDEMIAGTNKPPATANFPTVAPRAVAAAPPVITQEESAQAVHSRLSGLRNLAFTLKPKAPGEAGEGESTAAQLVTEAAAVESTIASREPVSLFAAPQKTSRPAPAPLRYSVPVAPASVEPVSVAPVADVNSASREVTVAPEILPPQPLEATLRDFPDTVLTLPSQHGQYRRKR